MPGKIEILTSLLEVNPAEWDRVTGKDRFIAMHGYLLAIERSKVNDCEHRYFLYRDTQGTLIAHAGFYTITTRFDVFLPKDHVMNPIITSIRRIFPQFLHSKMVECGTPTALGHTLAIHKAVPAAERVQILKDLIESLRQYARDNKAQFVVIRDFRADQISEYAVFKACGFDVIPALENTVFHVRWRTFGEYLASLKRHYRRLIKRDMSLAEAMGIRKQEVWDFGAYAEDMKRLWQMTSDHSKGYQRETLEADYFRNINNCVVGRTKATFFWLESRLVAFVLYWIDDTILIAAYSGIDYEYNKQAALVFNTYHDIIQNGIEMGKKHIKLGNTAYVAKLRMGAEIEPLYMFSQYHWQCLSPLLAKMFAFITPQQKRQRWDVFKH
jgi:predicted N-acyltransferase